MLKSTLKACNIPVAKWQDMAQDRPAWRTAIRKGTLHRESERLLSLDDKRAARKTRTLDLSTAVLAGFVGGSAHPLLDSGLTCESTGTDPSSSPAKDIYLLTFLTHSSSFVLVFVGVVALVWFVC